MKTLKTAAIASMTAILAISTTTLACAQEPEATAAAVEQSARQTVPALMRSQGALAQHASEKLLLRFSVFATEDSREPAWTEQQMVQLGPKGEYSVLLGAGSAIGLPQTLFVAGEPRWLAVQVGDHEETRTLLTSVPYAMKAADAETVGGLSASSFVTRAELTAKLRSTAEALAAQAIQPQATPTGGGTAGMIPLWTSATALGNSALTQTGIGATAKVGIGTPAPLATLDVAGTLNVRSTSKLGTGVAATAGAAINSPIFQLGASSYSSVTAAAVAQNFAWQAQALGNDTAAPSSSLALLFGAGAAVPKATGLSIAPTGVITFAPTQTFPVKGTGGGTITGITAGSGLTGGGTSGAVTLAIDTKKVPLLTATNTFTKGANFSAESVFSGSSADYMLKVINSNQDANGAIYAEGKGFVPGIVAETVNGYGVLGLAGDGIGGGFGNTSSGNPTLSVSNTIGPTADFAATSDTIPALAVGNGSLATGAVGIQSNIGPGIAISAVATTGVGLESVVGDGFGTYAENASATHPTAFIANTAASGDALHSEAGNGFAGLFTNSSGSSAAIFAGNSGGTAISASSSGNGILVNNQGGSQKYTYDGVASILASAGDASAGSGYNAAIVGMVDNGFAGVFENDSDTYATVSIYNAIGTTGLFRVLTASSPSGTCGVGGNGDMTCTGQMKSIVSTASARKVETYSVQSSENWLEDYGAGKLENGKAVVSLDAAFVDAADTGIAYHVFLTPKGDAQTLYVTNETAAGFEVRESGRGTDSIAFDYRIVAKRPGLETQRLVDVTERVEAELKSASLHSISGASSGNSPATHVVLPQRSAPPATIARGPVRPARRAALPKLKPQQATVTR